MRLLLDSHALIWMLEESPRLSERAALAINNPENLVRISFVSLWEITIKVALGKLRLRTPWPETLREIERRTPNHLHSVSCEHLAKLFALPNLHRDPFDRMLVAQALCDDLTLVSVDHHIQWGQVRDALLPVNEEALRLPFAQFSTNSIRRSFKIGMRSRRRSANGASSLRTLPTTRN